MAFGEQEQERKDRLAEVIQRACMLPAMSEGTLVQLRTLTAKKCLVCVCVLTCDVGTPLSGLFLGSDIKMQVNIPCSRPGI